MTHSITFNPFSRYATLTVKEKKKKKDIQTNIGRSKT